MVVLQPSDWRWLQQCCRIACRNLRGKKDLCHCLCSLCIRLPTVVDFFQLGSEPRHLCCSFFSFCLVSIRASCCNLHGSACPMFGFGCRLSPFVIIRKELSMSTNRPLESHCLYNSHIRLALSSSIISRQSFSTGVPNQGTVVRFCRSATAAG
jgi:hypothetical protein